MRWKSRWFNRFHWHRWFAWHPVLTHEWVWLEYVERRRVCKLGSGGRWEYSDV